LFVCLFVCLFVACASVHVCVHMNGAHAHVNTVCVCVLTLQNAKHTAGIRKAFVCVSA
jgi:hypothetical protein